MTPRTRRDLDVSDHLYIRWRRRAGNPDVSPRQAWTTGVRVDGLHGLNADEVRYHRPTHCVLVRRGDVLVTAIAVDDARDSVQRAVHDLGPAADGGGSV